MATPRVITPFRSSRDGRSPRNGRRKSGTPSNDDSPSRQLLLDLDRAMGRMQIHTTELQKVRAFNRRSYYEGLEAWTQERTEADLAAIDAANARHEAVRQDAEAELQRYWNQCQEEEAHRNAEEERIEKERLAREKLERERRETEEAERQATIQREKEATAAKKVAEEKARADAEEAQRKEREETAAREKAAQEEAAEQAAADQRAEDDAVARQQRQQQQAQAAAAKVQAAASGTSPELQAEHKRYLDIHANLKKFRKEFMVHAKSDPKLKPQVGDMRRAMRTSIGQLTDSKEKGVNTKPTQRIRATLLAATTEVASPPVNLTPYIYIDNKLPATHIETTIPSLLLYLLSMLSKAVFASFTTECAVNPKAAEPIGTLVAQIFSNADLQVTINPTDPSSTTSLISILISKMHATCPVLFGITGDESTSAGRQALGWRREFTNNNASQKSHVAETQHYTRLVGLSAGFAAISLRNFAKTKSQNPYPPRHFWSSLACIVNAPPSKIQNSHLIVLKNMLEGGVDRFLLFYGNVGVAALREALVVLPQKLQRQGQPKIMEGLAGKGLMFLVDTLEKEKNLRLR